MVVEVFRSFIQEKIVLPYCKYCNTSAYQQKYLVKVPVQQCTVSWPRPVLGKQAETPGSYWLQPEINWDITKKGKVVIYTFIFVQILKCYLVIIIFNKLPICCVCKVTSSQICAVD